MITPGLLSELYDKAKVNYELAEHDWLLTEDLDYLESTCIHLGEMRAYENLLEILVKE